MSNTAIRDYFITELENSSPQTLRVHLFWCDKFLSCAPEKLSEWDKRLVSKFRTKLEKDEHPYSTETVRMALGVVKRVFDAAKAVHEAERTRMLGLVNPKDETAVAELLATMSLPGPRWDVGKRYLPRAQADEITRPRMEMAEIQKIVQAARGGKLDKPETAFVALSSVYGYRAGEIRTVQREDLDYRHGTIYVKTEKGGERRLQLLVPEIIPYLKKYEWDFDFSADQMTCMFKAICKTAGVALVYRRSWHAFRRTLETDIRDSLACDKELTRDPVTILHIFFRYRMVSSREMPDRYYSMDSLQADKLALAHNPVVALWV
jgi:integrase